MRNHTHAEIAVVVWGLLLALVAVPQRARARIVALADEYGRTVHVNANVRELRIAPRNLPGQARSFPPATDTVSRSYDRKANGTAGDRKPTLSYSFPIHRYVDARRAIHFSQ